MDWLLNFLVKKFGTVFAYRFGMKPDFTFCQLFNVNNLAEWLKPICSFFLPYISNYHVQMLIIVMVLLYISNVNVWKQKLNLFFVILWLLCWLSANCVSNWLLNHRRFDDYIIMYAHKLEYYSTFQFHTHIKLVRTLGKFERSTGYLFNW